MDLPVDPEQDRAGGPDDADAMRLVAGLGAAMASADHPVTMVRDTMVVASHQNGLDDQFRRRAPDLSLIGSAVRR